MYLTDLFLENVGPIERLDYRARLEADGRPKPVVLVGENGCGKTMALAYIADAMIELARRGYDDVAKGDHYFKIIDPLARRRGSRFSVGIVQFGSGKGKRVWYVEKTGRVESRPYLEQFGDRFDFEEWPDDEDYKNTSLEGFSPIEVVGQENDSEPGVLNDEDSDPEDGGGTSATGSPSEDEDNDEVVAEFIGNAVTCYFPAFRSERPHWLNTESVEQARGFRVPDAQAGMLGRRIVETQTSPDTYQWLLDVLIDGMLSAEDIGRKDSDSRKRMTHKLARGIRTQENINSLLRAILGDETVKLVLRSRRASSRLAIEGDRCFVPGLEYMSSGQSILFGIFSTIIRHADMITPRNSVRLDLIPGVVAIDEVDAHLHTSLQHEALPAFMKLFPRIQFILTSHSPLFLLGLDRQYGRDGFDIVELPTGRLISAERFGEFERSFECYKATKAFEESFQKRLSDDTKPLVLTEGKTDAQYIRTALELMGEQDLLEGLEIDCVGTVSEKGQTGGGDSHLNKIWNILAQNPSICSRRVLLLYDWDSKKSDAAIGKVLIRSIPKSAENDLHGIENLLASQLVLDESFWDEDTKQEKGGLKERTTRSLNKTRLCDHICKESPDRMHFSKFDPVVEILRHFFQAGT